MAGRAPQFDYLLKYITVGDLCVGKSNLLLRYSTGEFRSEYNSITGFESTAKNVNIDNLVYRIQLWDTGGQERF